MSYTSIYLPVKSSIHLPFKTPLVKLKDLTPTQFATFSLPLT
jgi:hypothetical protein